MDGGSAVLFDVDGRMASNPVPWPAEHGIAIDINNEFSVEVPCVRSALAALRSVYLRRGCRWRIATLASRPISVQSTMRNTSSTAWWKRVSVNVLVGRCCDSRPISHPSCSANLPNFLALCQRARPRAHHCSHRQPRPYLRRSRCYRSWLRYRLRYSCSSLSPRYADHTVDILNFCRQKKRACELRHRQTFKFRSICHSGLPSDLVVQLVRQRRPLCPRRQQCKPMHILCRNKKFADYGASRPALARQRNHYA